MQRSLLVAVVLFAAARADAQQRPGCDPYSWTQPEPAPRGAGRHCGDGRIGTFSAGCVRHCSGGCGSSGCGEPVCLEGTEVCDGARLGGATCASLGFAGGTLRCGSGCTAYDTSRCDVCFAGPDVSCGSTSVRGAVSDVRLTAGATSALLTLHEGGEARWALVDARARISAIRAIAGARIADAIPFASGFLLATQGAHGTIHRIDARGRARVIEELPATDRIDLWALDGGGALVTTGTAFGTPFLALDAGGVRVTMPPLPAHATRPDGSRMLIVDAGSSGTMVHPRPNGMHTEWVPTQGDAMIVFAIPGTSGAQIVRGGVILTGMGWSGHEGLLDVEVHLGPIPDRSDPRIAAAVPDGPVAPGSGLARLDTQGARTVDAWEPHGGPRFAVEAPVITAPAAREGVIADHASVAWRAAFAGGLVAALVGEDGATRVVVARVR